MVPHLVSGGAELLVLPAGDSKLLFIDAEPSLLDPGEGREASFGTWGKSLRVISPKKVQRTLTGQ